MGSLSLADDHRPLSKNDFPNAMPQVDPGTPPPLVMADYASYIGKGRSTVFGYAWLLLPGGRKVGCDRVFLAPETSFTDWLVTKWVRALDGHELTVDDYVLGSHSAGIPVPDLLYPNNKDSVIRYISCYNGGYRFDNLMPGRYLFFGILQDLKRAELPVPQVDEQLEADGLLHMYFYSELQPFEVAKVGYIISSPGIVVQREGYYQVTGFYINARFWGDKGGNPSP